MLRLCAVFAAVLVPVAWASVCDAVTEAEYQEHLKDPNFARAVKDKDAEMSKGKKHQTPDEYALMSQGFQDWMMKGGIEDAAKGWSAETVAADRAGVYSQCVDNYKHAFIGPSVRRA
jgi:hypothetical protein